MAYTHLTWNSPVVGTALPKATTEAFYIANCFIFIRKIDFPYEWPVPKNPHDYKRLIHDNTVRKTVKAELKRHVKPTILELPQQHNSHKTGSPATT